MQKVQIIVFVFVQFDNHNNLHITWGDFQLYLFKLDKE